MKAEAFRVWADVLPEPCALVAAVGEIVALNAPARRIGLNPGPLESWTSAGHVEHARAALRSAARTRQPLPVRLELASGASVNARVALLDRDERGSWLLLRVTTEAASRFVGLTEHVDRLRIELHRRRITEEALASERERLAVTLNSIGDGVIAVDTAARVLLLNPVAEQLTGWSLAEAVGRPMSEVFRIFDERSGQPAVNPVETVLATGRTVALANHTALESRDGTRRSIADSAAALRSADGRVQGVVLVFRDVTQQRRIEDELARANMLDSVGVLAGGIAHDFNNILTAILANLSLADRRLESHHPVKSRLDAAMAAATRAQDLTRQLLTFARGGAPIRTAMSVRELVLETATFAAQGSNVELRFEIAPEIWSAEADAGQVGQVVHNLVLNAQQAMPGGGSVTVRAENDVVGAVPHVPLTPGRYVRLTVTDGGPGFSPEYLARAFQPFFSTKPTGTGLGLATVYSIVRRHDGHMELANGPNGGACVSFWLPACDTEHPVVGRREAPVAHGAGRVLVMDDDPALRALAAECLAALGYEGAFAEDGAAAVRMYEEALRSGQAYDVVVMDLTVRGGMGGLEATQRLRQLDPGLRAIVSSGYSNDPVMADPPKYGFVGVLAKPWRLEDLARALASANAQTRSR
jgi:two-component system cell cycle sensor histidine kinase/response regulator CckA